MAEKVSQNTSDSDSEPEDISVDNKCVYCQKEEIKFITNPCKHKGACKKCAMRLATGGKCKTCKCMFARWQAWVK